MFHVKQSCQARSASSGFRESVGSLRRVFSRRGARVGNEVFHVEHSLERSASASAVGTRIPKSLCNISQTGRGSGISSSHKEEASQRIRHGDWLTPFPSRHLQYLRSILG